MPVVGGRCCADLESVLAGFIEPEGFVGAGSVVRLTGTAPLMPTYCPTFCRFRAFGLVTAPQGTVLKAGQPSGSTVIE